MGFRELLRDLKNHLGTYQAGSGEGGQEGGNRETPYSFETHRSLVTPPSPEPPSRPETPETMDGLFCQPVTILVPAGNGPVHSLKQLRTAEVEPDIDEPAPGEEALGEPALGEQEVDILLLLAEPEEERQQPPELQPEPQPQSQSEAIAQQSLVRQPIRPLTRTNVPSTGVAGSWSRNRDRHPWFTGRWWSAG